MKQLNIESTSNYLDIHDFAYIKKSWLDGSNADEGWIKYFDYNSQLMIKLKLINKYLIDDITPGTTKLLDVSTGFGWLPFICQKIGVKCVTTDTPSTTNMNKVILKYFQFNHKIFQFDRRPKNSFKGKWKPFGFSDKFNIITNLSIGSQSYWNKINWIDYMLILKDDYLLPGGSVLIQPNKSVGSKSLAEYSTIASTYGFDVCGGSLTYKFTLV